MHYLVEDIVDQYRDMELLPKIFDYETGELNACPQCGARMVLDWVYFIFSPFETMSHQSVLKCEKCHKKYTLW